MQEIKNDLKAIREDISDIKTDVAKNTIALDHHIKRTDVSERRLEKLEYSLIGLLVTVIGAALIKLVIG